MLGSSCLPLARSATLFIPVPLEQPDAVAIYILEHLAAIAHRGLQDLTGSLGMGLVSLAVPRFLRLRLRTRQPEISHLDGS